MNERSPRVLSAVMNEPWSSWMWSDRVRVTLGYPRNGWVLLALLTPAFNQALIVRCSDVFCPFPNLFDWLHQVRSVEFPAEVMIDEEGHFKILVARQSPFASDEMELYCFADEVPAEGEWHKKALFQCRTSRTDFIHEFAGECARWFEHDWQLLDYGGVDPDDCAEGYVPGEYLRTLNFAGLRDGA